FLNQRFRRSGSAHRHPRSPFEAELLEPQAKPRRPHRTASDRERRRLVDDAGQTASENPASPPAIASRSASAASLIYAPKVKGFDAGYRASQAILLNMCKDFSSPWPAPCTGSTHAATGLTTGRQENESHTHHGIHSVGQLGLLRSCGDMPS